MLRRLEWAVHVRCAKAGHVRLVRGKVLSKGRAVALRRISVVKFIVRTATRVQRLLKGALLVVQRPRHVAHLGKGAIAVRARRSKVLWGLECVLGRRKALSRPRLVKPARIRCVLRRVGVGAKAGRCQMVQGLLRLRQAGRRLPGPRPRRRGRLVAVCRRRPRRQGRHASTGGKDLPRIQHFRDGGSCHRPNLDRLHHDYCRRLW